MTRIFYFLFLVIFGCLVLGCDYKKNKLATDIADSSCKEVTNMLIDYSVGLVPVVGSLAEYAISDDLKNGLFCDCLKPSITQSLVKDYSEKQLEEISKDKIKKSKAILRAVDLRSDQILDCYKRKGFKGIKLLEKFLKSLD